MITFNRSLADDSQPYWVWGPLIFSGFYFMQTIIDFSHISVSNLCFILVNYLIFLLLYAKAVHLRGDTIIPWLIVMTVCIALATYFTFGSQSLFGYVAFLAGYTLNIKRAFMMLAGIGLAIFISGYYFTQSHPYFLVPALLITAGLFIFGVFTHRDAIFRMKENTNKKQVKQLVAIAERERIARDLHDVAGHSLSSIALKSELAEKYLQAGNYDKAQHEITEVAALSREVLAEIRHTVSGLKKQNLSQGINKFVSELENHGFTVNLNNELTQLPPAVESTIVLVLTEAITNILRHSNGNKVAIELVSSTSTITVNIGDNGKVLNFQPGNGLQGMSERCQAINGTLNINIVDGFALIIELPTGKAA
ncbi:MAG: sensor histidine kinase [Thalassotalea sp.]